MLDGLRQFLEILFVAGVLAGLLGWLHPIDWEQTRPEGALTLEQVLALPEGTVLFVDARSAVAFGEGHIPGAVNLNEDAWDDGSAGFLERWTPDSTVIVYCDSSACSASESVASRLRDELQIENVHVLEGGWESWQKSGQPIEAE